MYWKKIGKVLLFPHTAIMLILLPVATVFLVYAMVFVGTESAVAYAAYFLAAYTLTIWCIRIPRLIHLIRAFKDQNKYARLWFNDTHLRVNVSLYGSLIWNTAYAVFQLCLGIYHSSLWFYAMAGYYILLAVMRFFLVRHTSRYKPGEEMQTELLKYRACGIIFLVMNLALTLIIFFMVHWNRTFHHHEITTIAMAAYTFAAFAAAIVNIIKYHKYNSPVYSASKAISLAAACVSMLTLESTMLTTFGADQTEMLLRKVMLGVSGGMISVLIIAMAVYMILQSSKKLNLLKKAKEQTNGK